MRRPFSALRLWSRVRLGSRSAPVLHHALALGVLVGALASVGCGRSALVSSALPLKRVVLYRNGVAYFERGGHVDEDEVRFKMKETEVGDFLATLAVIEQGGSSVRAAAFPLQADDDGEEPKPRSMMTEDEKKGLKTVVLSLDGKEHDLAVGYIAASPVWRPSYRLVVYPNGQADLQTWGIVQNLSGEDWKDVRLSLVAGAPLAFEAQLGTPVIPERPIVTDNGEVIASVPQSETTLAREDQKGRPPPKAAKPSPEPAADIDHDGIPDSQDEEEAPLEKADKKTTTRHAAGPSGAGRSGRASAPPASPAQSVAPMGGAALARRDAPMAPPPPPPPGPSGPRNLRSLAAVAVAGGSTRYDLPNPVTVPDRSATMVMLLARRVPGESLFLFAPDGGVPDSVSHPFRVARFANKSGGLLERGPIAVFEQGSFLGQGMVDPLPDGASATVPFALERGLAVERETKGDELGERIAKIENSELTIERDAVTFTTYRVHNGLDHVAKVLVKHPRIPGARLNAPPKGTEDNVGTGAALIPTTAPIRGKVELVVDERQTTRRTTDWFSPIADNAMKAFLADPKTDRALAAKLSAAWQVRNEIVARATARQKVAEEQSTLSAQTEETRRNLKALEKNKTAEALRQKLTQRLAESANRLEELTKQTVEIDSKLAELRVQFKEGIREIKYLAPEPLHD